MDRLFEIRSEYVVTHFPMRPDTALSSANAAPTTRQEAGSALPAEQNSQRFANPVSRTYPKANHTVTFAVSAFRSK